MTRLDLQVFDRSDRAKLRLTGPQARWFLNQLLSADIDSLPDEQGCDALLLDARGKILFVLRVFCTQDAFLVDVDPGCADALMELLVGRVFTTEVEIETVQVSHIAVLGDGTDEAVNEVLQRMYVPETDLGICPYGDGWIVKTERPAEGLEIFAKSGGDDLKARLVSRGATLGSAERWRDIFISGGVATLGYEFDSTFLPQEAAMENAVSFTKGCYPGQEAVAMAQRGRVKKRLRHLVFGGPSAGGDITFEGALVGSVSEASCSGSFAIAAMKTLVPIGSMVQVGEGLTAEVRDLPGTYEAEKPPSARELRERLQGVPARPR